MKSDNKFISLNRKILVAVVIATMCFAMIASVVFYQTELTRSQDKTKLMINQLLDTVEYTSAIAAYTNNQQIASDVVNGLLRNDIVYEVIITGDQGLNLHQSKDAVINTTIQKIERSLLSPFGDKKIIGSIIVFPKGDYNLIEATHSALLNAINSSFLIALTAIIVLFLVKRNVLQLLTVVSDTLHEISAGEKERIPSLCNHKNDELGRLVSDINELLEVIESKFKNERELRKKIEQIEKQLRNIFESTSAGLFLLNKEGKVITHNPTFEKFVRDSNLSERELIGSDFKEFVDQKDEFKDMINSALKSKSFVAKDFALNTVNKDAPKQWIHCLLSKINDLNGEDLYEGVIFDISSRIHEENLIRYKAEYDALTGAFRRDPIERELEKYLKDPRQWPVVVLLLDLDGFKAVNDTYGHKAGDEVLIEVTRRLQSCIRTTDLIGRLGGDEFLIVLTQCEPEESKFNIARKIIQLIQEPVLISNELYVEIGVSIGLAVNLEPKTSVSGILRAADEAMYAVKKNGKNNFVLFQADGSYFTEAD